MSTFRDLSATELNDSCSVEVTGFSEGSINVFFIIIRIELKAFLPTVAEILFEMQTSIAESDGIGDFEVDEKSIKISK